VPLLQPEIPRLVHASVPATNMTQWDQVAVVHVIVRARPVLEVQILTVLPALQAIRITAKHAFFATRVVFNAMAQLRLIVSDVPLESTCTGMEHVNPRVQPR